MNAPLGLPADDVSSVAGDRSGVRAWCVMLLLGALLVSPADDVSSVAGESPADDVSSVAGDRMGEHPKC